MTAKSKPSTQPNEKVVRMRVVCVKPPDFSDAEFGIQDEKRAVHQVGPDADGNTHYDIEVRVKWDVKRQHPRFLGPWVHGPVNRQFLYLSWRCLESPAGVFSRRMKIHLFTITWEQIEGAERTGRVLEVVLSGTGRDGGLNCASVQPLGEGWVVREIPSHEPIQPIV